MTRTTIDTLSKNWLIPQNLWLLLEDSANKLGALRKVREVALALLPMEGQRCSYR